ncbi:MAG: tetratricopeptide repeat protein [Chloroflexota bacterium]|nr:tetratricopeptide repeat protein [Chloroflexota bacterium]
MNNPHQNLFHSVLPYIPQHIVEERLSDPDAPIVKGQFRQGTLVFADISGFTAMSEKLAELGREGAEELTRILNAYFTRMLDIASTYGGIQLKFGGDAMLLLFMGQQNAALGVRCAQQMQEVMQSFGQVSTSQGKFLLEMSIGVNSGEFFEASLGSIEDRLHYVFVGNEVDHTAKIEAIANAGEVFLGPQTCKELHDEIEIGEERDGYCKFICFRSKTIPTYLAPQRIHVDCDQALEQLLHFLPQQLIERIRTHPEYSNPEGEHRYVTTIFINLLGTNEVIRDHGRTHEEEITNIMNDYFCMIQHTVTKYDGLVIGCDLSTSGSKVLITFGAPASHEDDEERAIRFALDIREQLEKSEMPFKQKIGINSGHVYCGDVGSPSRKEYTVMGDSVNLAARLMSVAHEGQIVMGPSTHTRTTNKFVTKIQEPIKVKGKSQPIQTYLVEEEVRWEDLRHQNMNQGHLIGREDETKVLQKITAIAFTGQGQLLSITGPAGIGKSRLTQELVNLCIQQGGTIYTGDCQSYGTSTPYMPWIELFGSIFNLLSTDENDIRAKKIETSMNDLCPELSEWIAVMGELLHAPIPESNLMRSLDAKLRHQRLLDITLELIQAHARRNPILLVLEDLHWADKPSQELLGYIARNIAKHSILLCIVYRPKEGFEPDFLGYPNHTNITMKELSEQASLELARNVAQAGELPEELGQLILTKSQGNPFFVEEVVKSLLDSRQLQQDVLTGEYRPVGDVSQLDIPDTIQGVVMSRIDRLDPETRNVLRVASVIGRLFQYPVLKSIYPRNIEDQELFLRLDELSSFDLTRLQSPEPTPEYFFKHILTQEVAYESLLFSKRRELHSKIGTYFEENCMDHIEDYYELLCHHYNRTRDKSKTLQYSVKAGVKSKRMFANQEAIDFYQQALELARELYDDNLLLQGNLYEDLGDIHELVGQYDHALDDYKASLSCYNQASTDTGSPEIPQGLGTISMTRDQATDNVAILQRKIGMVYERTGEYDVALEWLDNGLKTLASGELVEHARFYAAKAGVQYRRGDYEQAKDWCKQSLDLASRAASPAEQAHASYLLGAVCTDLGNIDKALEYRQQSLIIYEQTGDFLGQAKVHNNLGVDYYYQGNWKKSKEHYERSLNIRETIGDVNGVATVSNNLGEIYSDQGHLEKALGAFYVCLRTWERTGYVLGVALSHANLGRAYTRRGDYSQALEHLIPSQTMFEKIQSRGFLIEVCQRLAEAYLGLGQPYIAIEYCNRSLNIALQHKMSVAEGSIRRIMGQSYHCLAQWKKAEELLKESKDILQDRKVPHELGQSLWQLANLYRDMAASDHDKERAAIMVDPPLTEAISIFDSLGIEFNRQRALELKELGRGQSLNRS